MASGPKLWDGEARQVSRERIRSNRLLEWWLPPCVHRLLSICIHPPRGKKKDGDWGQSEAVVAEESAVRAKKIEGGHACASPGCLIDST